MSPTTRLLSLGIVLGLALGLLAGFGLSQPGRAAALGSTARPSAARDVALGAGAGLPTGTTAATGAAKSATAIAYPWFGGSPGIAPDHTIVVTGVGEANLKADGSNRAAAQKIALTAALADAKGQADAIAAATGLTISGVLSVSAAVSPMYPILPMSGSATGGAPGVATSPAIAPAPTVPETLGVSVTVEYRVS